MLKVKQLYVNYQTAPTGIVHPPQLNWQLTSDHQNVHQVAFRLQWRIGTGPVKESQWFNSTRSAQIDTAHWLSPLIPATKYTLAVAVRDNHGETSAWSLQTTFITGVFAPLTWKAQFVAGESTESAKSSAATLIRQNFIIAAPVVAAYAYVSAHGLYHFYLNGDRVGKDELTPGWTSYHTRLQYQTYDVTKLLRPGDNAWGAMVGAGYYKGKMGFLLRRNNYGAQTAVIVQIVVQYVDGRQEVFYSDQDAKTSNAPVTFAEIYDGETYDARLEQPGFSKAFFNDKDWHPVVPVTDADTPLVPQIGASVQVIQELKLNRLFTTPKGELVLDCGQNLAGWLHFTLTANTGDEVRYQCFETLDAQGNVYLANLRSAKQCVHYYCRAGTQSYHPNFTYQGFRYIWLQSWPKQPELADFAVYALSSSMLTTGRFSCDHQLLNQLHDNINWSLNSNFVDIPTDCPQRDERVGWTGDAQIFCRTAMFLRNTYPFFTKWLQDVAADQTPAGGIPHVVPDIISGHAAKDWLLGQGTDSASAWADVAVIMPWMLYLTYGDTEILHQQYSSMKCWIDFMHQHSQNNIWNYRLQFGDWVALDAEPGSYFGATPNELTCTAYYAYTTGLFAKIAVITDHQADATFYQQLYKQIVATFQNHFFDDEGNMTAQTQTAHILAMYFHLVPKMWRTKTAKRLVELLHTAKDHLVTGFMGTPYFCFVLADNGYIDEAYDLLLKTDFPSWLYQVTNGATTVWEHWDGIKPDGSMWSADMNSFNHYAYGAIGDWLYRSVAGIQVDSQHPGYQQFTIAPLINRHLHHVTASFDAIPGMIKVEWRITAYDQVTLQVEIPPNTTATIKLANYLKVPVGFTKTGSKQFGSGTYQIKYQLC